MGVALFVALGTRRQAMNRTLIQFRIQVFPEIGCFTFSFFVFCFCCADAKALPVCKDRRLNGGLSGEVRIRRLPGRLTDYYSDVFFCKARVFFTFSR